MVWILAVLLNKSFQSLRVCLRPNAPATQTGIALGFELRTMLKRNSQKPDARRPENNVRKVLFARSSDFPLHDFRPAAFEAVGHMLG